MDQHRVAAADAQLRHRRGGGLPGSRHHSRLLPGHAGRFGDDLAFSGHHAFGVAGEHGPSEDFITGGEVRAVSDRVYDPGELVSEGLREVRRHPPVRRATTEQAVERLYPGCPDPDAHLSRSGHGLRNLAGVEDVRSTILIEDDRGCHGCSLSSVRGRRRGPAPVPNRVPKTVLHGGP